MVYVPTFYHRFQPNIDKYTITKRQVSTNFQGQKIPNPERSFSENPPSTWGPQNMLCSIYQWFEDVPSKEPTCLYNACILHNYIYNIMWIPPFGKGKTKTSSKVALWFVFCSSLWPVWKLCQSKAQHLHFSLRSRWFSCPPLVWLKPVFHCRIRLRFWDSLGIWDFNVVSEDDSCWEEILLRFLAPELWRIVWSRSHYEFWRWEERHSFDIHISPSAQVPQIIEKSWRKTMNAIIVTTQKYVSLTHLRYHPFLEGPLVSVSRCFEIAGIINLKNQEVIHGSQSIHWTGSLVTNRKRSVGPGVDSCHFTSQLAHVIWMCWN